MVRAGDATQKRILERLGVADVILPEEEVAKQVVQRLINPQILDLFRVSEDYSIVEVRAPERFWGQTLGELNMHQRFRCTVIAVKRPQSQEDEAREPEYRLQVPLPHLRLQEGDTLIVLGLGKDIERLTT